MICLSSRKKTDLRTPLVENFGLWSRHYFSLTCLFHCNAYLYIYPRLCPWEVRTKLLFDNKGNYRCLFKLLSQLSNYFIIKIAKIRASILTSSYPWHSSPPPQLLISSPSSPVKNSILVSVHTGKLIFLWNPIPSPLFLHFSPLSPHLVSLFPSVLYSSIILANFKSAAVRPPLKK